MKHPSTDRKKRYSFGCIFYQMSCPIFTDSMTRRKIVDATGYSEEHARRRVLAKAHGHGICLRFLDLLEVTT